MPRPEESVYVSRTKQGCGNTKLHESAISRGVRGSCLGLASPFPFLHASLVIADMPPGKHELAANDSLGGYPPSVDTPAVQTLLALAMWMTG